MFLKPHRSVTFMELLIAMVLLTAVIMAVNNIDIFSRYHVISADRRAKVQSDVSRCLDHIARYADKTIGNESTFGANTAVYISPDTTNTTTLSFFTDSNGNGLRETGTDVWVRYKLDTTTHYFSYCSQCPDSACAACSATEETLARDITAFSASKSGTPSNNFSKGNYINVSITGCWNPAATCNTPDNPTAAMSTTVTMPSLTTN